MLSQEKYFNLMHYILTSSKIEDLQDRLRMVRGLYGLSHVSFVGDRGSQFRAAQAIRLTTYVPTWTELYLRKKYYLLDPVHKLAITESMPFDWSDFKRDGKQTRAFFGEAHDHGVGSQGISFPLRGPRGDRGVFTLTAEVGKSEWHRRTYIYLRDICAVAQAIHCKAFELTADTQEWRLSPRESQCLLALADGSSTKKIAYQLKITQSAVRLYISNAKRKSGCRNLNHLIATAIDRGLLATVAADNHNDL